MKDIFVSSIRDESDKVFELAKEFNLGIEIQGFMQPYMITNMLETINNTKIKLTDIKKCSLHGPFIDLFPGSKDPEIIKVVKKRFSQAYNTTKILNAKHLILHAGYVPKSYFPDQWLKTSIDFWIDFSSQLDDDIEIHIENVCEDDYLLLSKLIEAVDNPRFTACLDIGHVNVNSSKSLETWIKGLNNKIGYVHLHNNDGASDGHYGLCRGNINIYNTLELLQIYAPDAKWSLETKLDETEESILYLKEHSFI
ncbi:MAG: TIM barrel protein [Clostridium sp.]|uniref:sugar phosphate isomerase/epimerase family protein n=1 Tax=Clostridium sp. TaxID=1506 RepID=UPI00302F1051